MQYTQIKGTGLKASRLGYGCMRFPLAENGRGDFDKAAQLIAKAIEGGVNYFDCGYFYQGGQSEKAMGEALRQVGRSTVIVTDKLPNTSAASRDSILKTVDEQLARTGLEYFDFYFLHNVNERSTATFTKDHVLKTLDELKNEGKVRNIGFSSHARPQSLKWFSAIYDFSLAQIQLNRFDWFFQDAKGQYEILKGRGIPVVVMEPLRGGRLASISEEADAILKAYEPDRSIASWGFRFAMGLDGVAVILSGMNSAEQLADNLDTFDEAKPLSEEDLARFDAALDILREAGLVPCTKCRYCVDGCPQKLDIPELIEHYNGYLLSRHFMELLRLSWMRESQLPKNCIECGQCREKCPQNIDVPGVMKSLTTILENASRRR